MRGRVMASPHNTRRFYIDQEADHAVVRTVPVRRPESQISPDTSPATHQVQPAISTSHHLHLPRIQPRRVGQLLRTARKRQQHDAT